MNARSTAPPETGCCICGSEGSATIEFDRPVILLCQCDACGKFIVTRSALEALLQEPDFVQCRNRISDLIRDYFRRHNRPLEIVLNGDPSKTPYHMSVKQLIKQVRVDRG